MANTTWNPADKTASVTLTGSNLIATDGAVVVQGVRSIDKQTSGKFYWEITMTSTASYGAGCANASAVLTSFYNTPSNAVLVYVTGAIWVNNANTGLTTGTFAAGGLKLCIALDLTGNLFWARNGAAGNWNGNVSANPATGTLGTSIASIVSTGLFAAAAFNGASSVTANFGDTAFSGVVPTGFTSGFSGGAVAGASQAIAMVLA